MTQVTATPIHDTTTEFYDNVDGSVIKRQQEIPDDFVSDLKKRKIDADHERTGDFLLAASVPVIIHEEWLKEGYDMTREPAAKTLARLRAKGLDAFITTNKRI